MAPPNASTWAPVQNYAGAPAPDVLSSLPGGGSAPPVFAPAPAPASPDQISNDQQQLEKVRWQQANPWGTPENHPGKLGKIAHAFSTLGNIAGDIFAPAVTANIPGSQLNLKGQEQGLTHRLNAEIGDESQNAYRNAETGKTQEETAEAPGKAASEEGLQGAQTAEAQAKVNQGPDLATAYAHRVNQVLKEGGDPATDPTVMHLQDAITSIQRQPAPRADESKTTDILGPDGKEHTMGWDDKTKRYDVDMGRKGEKPTQAPGVTMIVPGADGQQRVERLTTGQTVAPGAQTATGINAENTPTMQQRTAAGRAATVVAMAPEVLGRIDSMASKLGPVEGRWNDFMQGKVGMDDPDFAALRSDLLMMSSAVALAHAQGRLPENLREEFDHAINAPKQTPQNLKATIQTMLPWLQKMQEQGHPQNGGAPQGGNEPKVLKFNQATGRLE
jgi:hypothetical protein